MTVLGLVLVTVVAWCAGSCAAQTATTAGASTAPSRASRVARQARHRGARRRRAERRVVRVAADAQGGLSLITEPAAGIAPVLRAIHGAHRRIDLVMYEDEDAAVDAALAAAARRGVHVRVLLNGGYYGGGSSENAPAYRFLHAHGVAVRWTPAFFALTHEKALVVDGRAYILTFNFTPQYYSSSRDFGVVDGGARDVAAVETTFDADWEHRRIVAPDGAELVWSPGSEPALLALIDSARGWLDVENEEMDEPYVERALESAARRGVDVKVTMTADASWTRAFSALAAAGVHVHTYAESAPLYIHAKLILTEGRAFLGSENFSYSSLFDNRELGIVLSTPGILRSLRRTFDSDYAGAPAFRGA